MLKLSQKAWNNVIIVSMLILIVLFNASSNFLNGGADTTESTHLLPADSEISTLDFGQYKIERIGQGWRGVGIKATSQQIMRVISHWQNAQTETLSHNVSLGQAKRTLVVQAYLTGQSQAVRIELFEFADFTVVNTGKQLLQLKHNNLQALTLQENTDA